MRYIIAFISALLAGLPAFASQPTPGALGLQEPATRIMERMVSFHNGLLIAITIITIFVTALLLIVIMRYNRRANPQARKFSHNTAVEIVWTVVPVIILVAIAGPSFSNLFYQENEPDLEQIAQSGDFDNPDIFIEAAQQDWITVKAEGMGNWAWTYHYPNELDVDGYPISYVSNAIHFGLPTDPPATPEKPRYLATDNPMVIPANRYIRYQTTSDRVIHSWAVPSFGIKMDAVPGRLNEGWFLVNEPGVYYGQCSELCGKNHAFMPIEVRVVPQAQYDRWLELMRAGEVEAATATVQQIASVEEVTRLAMAE
ncbi:MAG: cytochrome c oxidase subunit II [Alphaproteobacteria bacterium]|nr:cytochrome c oxidase subunit II [Alphaproteobacteria bacterium]